MEKGLRPDKRKTLAKLLKTDVHSRFIDAPSYFVRAFDNLFGPKIVAIRFVGVSSALSLAFSLTFTLLWIYVGRPSQMAHLNHPDYHDLTGGMGWERLIWNWIWIFLVIGIPADYCSNAETRLLLGRISNARSRRGMLGWMAVDLALSVLIFGIWFFLMVNAEHLWARLPVSDAISDSLDKTLELFNYGLILANNLRPFHVGPVVVVYRLSLSNGIFLYSSLLTSLWLWLYCIAVGLVRVAYRAERFRRLIARWFNVDKQPMLVLGIAAAILSVVVLGSLMILWEIHTGA
jgi:hypothetical protein